MRPEVSNSPFQNASFLLPPHAWAPALIQVTQIAWTAHATRRTRKLLGSYSIHPNSWLRKRNICVNRQSFELSNSRYHPPTPPPCKWAKGVNVRPVDNLVDTFAESHKVTIHAEQGSHSGNVMTMHTKTWVGTRRPSVWSPLYMLRAWNRRIGCSIFCSARRGRHGAC